MKRLFFTFLIFFSFLQVIAEENMLLVDEAGKKYNDGLYQSAIELYERVLQNGYESFELYYNLGNSFFKINDMASAILYYEKARKINPNDEDVNFNLVIANNRIVDKIETVPELFYIRWWKTLIHALDVDQWAWVSIISFTLALGMTLMFLISGQINYRKFGFWLGIMFFVFSLSSFALANQRYKSFNSDHEAIIFTPTVTVKSSPNETSIDLFVIHEGTKVQLTDHIGAWYEIRIANGSVGWISETDLRKI